MEKELANLQNPATAAALGSSRTILVTVPASVAYNFDKMQKVSQTVLGKLGCPGCHSGFDIRFIMERQFRFNEKLEMVEGARERFEMLEG